MISATDFLNSINSSSSVVQEVVRCLNWAQWQNPGHFKGYLQKPINPTNIHFFFFWQKLGKQVTVLNSKCKEDGCMKQWNPLLPKMWTQKGFWIRREVKIENKRETNIVKCSGKVRWHTKANANPGSTRQGHIYAPLSSIKKLLSLRGVEAVCVVNFHLEKIFPDWGFKHEFNMSFPLITLNISADVSGRY